MESFLALDVTIRPIEGYQIFCDRPGRADGLLLVHRLHPTAYGHEAGRRLPSIAKPALDCIEGPNDLSCEVAFCGRYKHPHQPIQHGGNRSFRAPIY